MKWTQITQKHFQMGDFRVPNASYSKKKLKKKKKKEHHKLSSLLKDRTEACEQKLTAVSSRQSSQRW